MRTWNKASRLLGEAVGSFLRACIGTYVPTLNGHDRPQAEATG